MEYRNYTFAVEGTVTTMAIVTRLVDAGQWFAVKPIPDNQFDISVWEENASLLDAFVREALKLENR